MPIIERSETRFFVFETLRSYPLTQAIFTRHGGSSPKPWASLNVGGTVGDDPGRVLANRVKVFEALGLPGESAHDVWQVHSADFVHAAAPRGAAPGVKADILLSASPDVTLFMRFADCLPIFLYDPLTPAIAMVHAGWLGTVRRAAEAAVRAMTETFGTKPAELIAGLGPGIGPDHYQVGSDVISQFEASFGESAAAHLHTVDGSRHLDLWTANAQLLQDQGVQTIEFSGICTACENQDWYSHRAERGQTGRFAALFSLDQT